MKRCALLLTLLAACSPAPESDDPPAGILVYRRQGCVGCHGEGGVGGMLAPPLADLGANWTREELASYFEDPAPHIERKPHLKVLAEEWPAAMPTHRATEAEFLDLADYVLSLSSSD